MSETLTEQQSPAASTRGATGQASTTSSISADLLPTLVITLLKGVIYQEIDAQLWSAVLKLQARVRDYVAIMGLELILDESEGYCFLRSKQQDTLSEEDLAIPRLMARRQLSFPVSLLLALLRKRLAEFDARGGDTRLVLTLEEIVELIRVFFPSGSNDAKLINQVETHINKIIELGFLKKMKSQSVGDDRFEVRRILKAFVDAQWLSELDAKLQQYQNHLGGIDGATRDD
jgi:hypothetical protein